jgi:hypothetical protein
MLSRFDRLSALVTGPLAVVLWIAGVLRTRLAAAETDDHTLSTIAYGGAVAAGIFGIGTQADISSSPSCCGSARSAGRP